MSNYRLFWSNLCEMRQAFEIECSELGPRLHGIVPGQALSVFWGNAGDHETDVFFRSSLWKTRNVRSWVQWAEGKLARSLRKGASHDRGAEDNLYRKLQRHQVCGLCVSCACRQSSRSFWGNIALYVLCVHSSRVGSHFEEDCNTVFCACMPAELEVVPQELFKFRSVCIWCAILVSCMHFSRTHCDACTSMNTNRSALDVSCLFDVCVQSPCNKAGKTVLCHVGRA